MTLADYFLENERQVLWHPERNLPLRPEELSPGSHRRVWWQCVSGHSWQAQVYSVTIIGSGCPCCSGLKPIPGQTDLGTQRPDIARYWDGERNAPLTPRDVTSGSKTKVWWRCASGHSWRAKVYSVVLDGCFCPYCAGKKVISGKTDIVTVRPEIAAQWDYEKNGNLDIAKVLPSSHEKYWWRCQLGHSWQAAPFSRTKERGSGCPYCTGRKVLPGFNDLATKKPGLAEEWYQTLNGDLKPTDVTPGSNKKVWWRCSEHHVWQAAIYARAKKNGTSCPICAGTVKQKKPPIKLHLRTAAPTGAAISAPQK